MKSTPALDRHQEQRVAVWRRRLAVFVVGLWSLCLWTACGPTQSTININEAEVALEKARVVNAKEAAPYEYYSSKEYLYKAKEEWGYSDFEASADYAALAKKFAEEALKKAKGVPETPEKKPGKSADSEADALDARDDAREQTEGAQ